MRTVSIFKNARNQAIRIPKDMEFEGVTELEIRREGDTLLLRPVRPTWLSFASEPLADADFLAERPAVIEAGRFDLSGGGAVPTESDQ
ncbi:AbrB family transcriptional regulator [Burkholderia lata]|uniref:type II toxin-antitoxin system VapB family antitoxin n=1 Tax=Burkholderia lata (strain ATCC 17760 / DSM 23089 / LMG 22485 / NCIMB 9086 / R18194 / 383) TaxID=482957 RepID=UPI001454AECF|nr:type II toxin-antitoxin system VapB family antitoxin [Burkholderia lata]VWD25180.1 AbrB family transcriptional regulator [Burkholderia lata]